METVIKYIAQLGLDDFGALASMVGLLLTLIVLFNIRKIKHQFFFLARASDLCKKLELFNSTVIQLLQDFESNDDRIGIELARAEALLETLMNMPRASKRLPLENLHSQISDYRGNNRRSENKVRKILTDSYKLVAKIEEHRENLRWER